MTATLSLLAATAILVSGCGTEADTSKDSALLVPELNELLPQKVRDAGVFTVATDPQYPPCDFTNDSGKIDGFNHDILMAMAPRLGVEIRQEAIAFDGLLPGVQSGRFDAAMECITDNVERQKTVKFVDYAYATKSVITTSENKRGITENPLTACGLKAGVQTGTEFVQDAELFSKNCESEGKAPLQITNFPTAGDQNTALQSGRIDFAFTNTATGVWQAKASNGQFKIIPSPLLSRTYVGIVVGLQSDDTAKALLGALEAIIKDGTYDKIMAEWDLKDIALDKPGINLATERPLDVPKVCGSCGS
ncbi:ABC transporter substrate-binding protein [Micromonospora inyonensis]|uniref:ABC transporter substrate-binding protein n=1 Tax=Micromonospora inyonensis TaxID=47866 RepID=UPI00159F1CA4|nr:ABC transporter substrate-binding protein [Micromonospora inyonensis]